MNRQNYTIFSAARIGALTLPNRIVRSATNEGLQLSRRVSGTIVDLYRRLAEGGTGLIITGYLPAAERAANDAVLPPFKPVAIDGIEQLVETTHRYGNGAKIIAQIGANDLGLYASDYPTPFGSRRLKPVSQAEIEQIINCFVETICSLKHKGVDGVQLHGAHGYFLCSFLSPFMNRRRDGYGGSVTNRVRIIREIVSQARREVGPFPILIKMNCTDYMPGESIEVFVQTAEEIEKAGIDAIEISGGIVESLTRSEAELGFPAVLNAPAHTRIDSPEKQSYFLKHAESLNLDIPLILVGGNRDVERLEEIVDRGGVDFIAFSRPLIREPDLPERWLRGQGETRARCISCNSCFYPLYNSDSYTGLRCLHQEDREQHKKAQQWLTGWVRSMTAGSS